MIIISPFTPIFFNPSSDTSGVKSRYIQLFSNSDKILLEVILYKETSQITGTIYNIDGSIYSFISWDIWDINATDKLYYCILTNMPDGYYYISINGNLSEVFRITSNEKELTNTVLLQCSNQDNKQRRDAVFWIGNLQVFFEFRIPGGFKDNDWSFGVDNEQYTDADYNITEIYAMERTYKTLTIGSSIGCPIWFADILNRLLTCMYVYIDGERYVRAESDIPEVNIIIEGKKSYVFKQRLLKCVSLSENDNLLKTRRVNNEIYRITTDKILII